MPLLASSIAMATTQPLSPRHVIIGPWSIMIIDFIRIHLRHCCGSQCLLCRRPLERQTKTPSPYSRTVTRPVSREYFEREGHLRSRCTSLHTVARCKPKTLASDAIICLGSTVSCIPSAVIFRAPTAAIWRASGISRRAACLRRSALYLRRPPARL